MAIQDFVTGQVLTSTEMDNLQTNDYNQTVSAKTASYVLVAADKGTRITMSNAGATTITVNTSLFTAGDTLFITNIGAGACTITAGTATVSTASSLVLAQYDSGRLYFTSTGVAIWEKYQGAAAGGGGKVLQVVQGTTSTQVINSTSTFADTTLTASITPSATTSKVLILIVQQNVAHAANDASASIPIRLLRGATDLGTFAPQMFYQNAVQWFIGQVSINYLDSPATTSATTYKTQFNVQWAGTVEDGYVQKGNLGKSTIILMEIGA
jgi:hypothetical protein